MQHPVVEERRRLSRKPLRADCREWGKDDVRRKTRSSVLKIVEISEENQRYTALGCLSQDNRMGPELVNECSWRWVLILGLHSTAVGSGFGLAGGDKKVCTVVSHCENSDKKQRL